MKVHKYTHLLLACTATLGFLLTGCDGPTKKGIEARNEANDRYSENVSALVAQSAKQDFSVGSLKQALINIEGAIQRQPDNPDHHVMRARILIEMNQLSNAHDSLNYAITLDSDHADAHYYIGLVFQRWSNDKQAIVHYETAYQLDEDSMDYALATIETLMTLQQYDAAADHIAEGMDRFQHVAAFRRTSGHLSLILGDPETAAESFYQAVLLAPEENDIVIDLAYALFESGQYTKSQFYLERLVDDTALKDRRDLRQMIARCQAESDHLVEARQSYMTLLDQDPSDYACWHELGCVSLKLGDLRRAHNVASKMITMWPQNMEGYVVRGLAYQTDDDIAKAIIAFQQAAKYANDDPDPYVLLGLVLEMAGQYEDAKAAYQSAMRISPNSEYAYQLLTAVELQDDVRTTSWE